MEEVAGEMDAKKEREVSLGPYRSLSILLAALPALCQPSSWSQPDLGVILSSPEKHTTCSSTAPAKPDRDTNGRDGRQVALRFSLLVEQAG